MASWKEKIGHTTIDLGIAQEKLESYHDGDIKNVDTMERLASVKGHLVSFPLEFMCQENLRPAFNESEYYATQVFHWVLRNPSTQIILILFILGICNLLLAEYIFITVLQVSRDIEGGSRVHDILVKNVSVTVHCKNPSVQILKEKKKE